MGELRGFEEPGMNMLALTDGAPIVSLETSVGIENSVDKGPVPVFNVLCSAGFYDKSKGLSRHTTPEGDTIEAAAQFGNVTLLRVGSVVDGEDAQQRILPTHRLADEGITIINPLTGDYTSERGAQQLVGSLEDSDASDKIAFTFVGNDAVDGLKRFLFRGDIPEEVAIEDVPRERLTQVTRAEIKHINHAVNDALDWAKGQARGDLPPSAEVWLDRITEE